MTISSHRHQLPGGGAPHEAGFVGTPSGGPGLTRFRGAGFLLRRRVPSKAGSYLGSTGPSATDGEHEHVPGSVHVSVDDQTASLTPIDTLGQGQLGFRHPTGGAGLGAGEEPVGDDEATATPDGLVPELLSHRSEGLVGKASGQPPVAQHPGHVQILDHHHLVPRGQQRRGLVDGIEAEGVPTKLASWGAPQVRDSHVDADRRPRPPMKLRNLALDLHAERHEPALSGAGHGGGEDSGLPLRHLASQRLGGFVGADGAPNLGRVTVVPEQRITPVLKRKESRHRPFRLRLGNPSRLPFRWPFLAARKSRRARSRLRKASCALGVLSPPGQLRVPLLLLVPEPVQVDSRVPLPLRLVALPALIQAPVPGVPGCSGMRAQPLLLGGGGIEREPVGLVHLHRGSLPVMACTARAARLLAARLPYRRAHREVRISVTSRPRSSSTSLGSTTTSRLPVASSAASTYSAPKRAKRSRCSTRIVVTPASRRSARNRRRLPLSADPTSDTTWSMRYPCPVAQAVTRAICRSRSAR